MKTKIAINGFGRIGRLTFRKIFGSDEFDIVAINDLSQPDMLAYLLKYDSVQKAYEGHTVEHDEASIIVDGKKIPIDKEADPSKLPWGDLDVDIVLECTTASLPEKTRSSPALPALPTVWPPWPKR